VPDDLHPLSGPLMDGANGVDRAFSRELDVAGGLVDQLDGADVVAHGREDPAEVAAPVPFAGLGGGVHQQHGLVLALEGGRAGERLGEGVG
jgi:hypothetical protein